jgi:hypothetical protein
MTVSTGNLPRLLELGINSTYDRDYNAHQTEFDKIFDVSGSKKAYELDVQVEGLGLAEQKPEGKDLAFEDFSQGFTPKYIQHTYAKGFIMTKEAIADNLYEKGYAKASSLARSINVTKEIVHANILSRGFNSNYTMPGGDGLPLFSTSHIKGPSGGTFGNKLTVDADLSEASLEDMNIKIGKATDSKGLQIAIKSKCLIVPVDLEFEATRILKSSLQSGTANNDLNAMKEMNTFSKGIVVNHYLTEVGAWYIKTDVPKGLRSFNRQSASFERDMAFVSKNARFSVDERYSAGWTDPLGIFGSSGS